MVVVVVVVGAWLGVNATGDSWIATHGKDTAAVGTCPFNDCTDVVYTGHLGAWYSPPAPGHATVVIVHGYGANRGDHADVSNSLQQLGYGIPAVGLGYEGDTADDDATYGGGVPEADDVKTAVAYARSRSGGPVVLLGYSAGGNESILAVSRGGRRGRRGGSSARHRSTRACSARAARSAA